MKKRLRKKLYKAVLDAKFEAAENPWLVLAKGYDPRFKAPSRYKEACRRVIVAGGFYRQNGWEWSFPLPKTRQCMRLNPAQLSRMETCDWANADEEGNPPSSNSTCASCGKQFALQDLMR